MKLGKKIMLLAFSVQLFLVGVAAILGISALGSQHRLLAASTLKLLELASFNFSGSLEEIDALTYKMLGDPTLQRELTSVASAQDKQAQMNSYQKLYQRLVRYAQESNAMGVRHIWLQTDAYAVTTAYQRPEAAFQSAIDALIRNAKRGNGRIVYDTGLCMQNHLLAARAIRQISPFTLSVTGTVVLDIDMDQLVAQATNSSADADALYWIMDEAGESFYHSDELTAEDLTAISAHMDDPPHVIQLNGGRYFMCHGVLDGGAGWGYTLLLSYEEQWRAQCNAYLMFLLALLCAMGVASFITRAIVKSITGDIHALLRKMNRFQSQLTESKTALPSLVKENENEIAVLHKYFDSMADRVLTLVQERYVSELLAKDAQLQALEAQINPHFLYNVLESINCRARLAGNRDIASIVEALGRLLRVALDKHSKLLPLRDELSLVHDYLAIQRQRYEDGFTYCEAVPEELTHVLIPKMAIQPLVENAIKFALENGIDDQCRIEVSASETPEGIVIAVANSGSAFPNHMLGAFREENGERHGFGIGMANIYQRIRLTYGERGNLYLANENDMAICRLVIPRNDGDGEGEDAC